MTKENLKIPLTLKFLSFVCIFLGTIFLFIAYVVFGSIDVSEILNVSWGYAFALLLPIVLFPLILFGIFKKNKRLLYITIIVLTVVLFLLDVLLTTDPGFNLLNYSFLVILLTVFLLFFYPKNKLLWIFLFLHIIGLITGYLNLYSFEDVFDIYTTGRIIGDIIFLILVVGQFIFIKKNYDLIKNNDNKISWVKRNLLFTIGIIAIIVSLYIYLNEYELFWISIAIISVFVLLQISLTTRLKGLFVYLYSIKVKEPRFVTEKNQLLGIWISGVITFLAILACFLFVYNTKVNLPDIDDKYFDVEGGFANLKNEENGFYHIKILFENLYLEKESIIGDLKQKYEKDENCILKSNAKNNWTGNMCICGELNGCFRTEQNRKNYTSRTFLNLIANEKQISAMSYEHKDYEATPDQLYDTIKEKNIAFEPYFRLLDEYYPKYKDIVEKYELQSGVGYKSLPFGIKGMQDFFRDIEVYAFYNCYIKDYDKCTDMLSTNYKFAKKFLESKGGIPSTVIGITLLETHMKNIIYMLDNMDIPEQYKNFIKKDFQDNIDFDKILSNTMKAEYYAVEWNIPDMSEYVIEIPLKENGYLFNYEETEIILKNYFKNMIENKNFDGGNANLEVLLSQKYRLLFFWGGKNFRDYTKYFSNRYGIDYLLSMLQGNDGFKGRIDHVRQRISEIQEKLK